jgi:TorA maturation chaperone TorD
VGARQDQARAPGHDPVRGHAWSLLGALLAASPRRDLLERLASVDAGAEAGGGFADAWRELAIAARHADGGALVREYQDLFIGIGRGEVVPYGCWYMTGFLMDKPLAVLRADLAALGIARQDEVKEPEDHAAALCETMAMLVDEGHDLDGQRRFFEAHMGPWMPAFFRDLQSAPSAGFYRAVGHFGEQLVSFESRYLAMAV